MKTTRTLTITVEMPAEKQDAFFDAVVSSLSGLQEVVEAKVSEDNVEVVAPAGEPETNVLKGFTDYEAAPIGTQVWFLNDTLQYFEKMAPNLWINSMNATADNDTTLGDSFEGRHIKRWGR